MTTEIDGVMLHLVEVIATFVIDIFSATTSTNALGEELLELAWFAPFHAK